MGACVYLQADRKLLAQIPFDNFLEVDENMVTPYFTELFRKYIHIEATLLWHGKSG